MYFTDPTLYGATLPRKELSTPFYGHMMPWQNLPIQQLPFQGYGYQNFPFQNYGYQSYPQFQNLPLQNVPWQNMPPIHQGAWQQFVPQMYGYGANPYFKQPFGYTPTGLNPYVQSGAANVPFFASWQSHWA